MKITLIISLILALSSTVFSEVLKAPPMQITDRQVEMAEGKILKIYSTKQDGAHSQTYVVEWNGSEIVVFDPWNLAKKEEGELLEFIVNKVDFEREGKEAKVIHFMVMEKHKMIELTSPPDPEKVREIEELKASIEATMKKIEARTQEVKERSNQSQ